MQLMTQACFHGTSSDLKVKTTQIVIGYVLYGFGRGSVFRRGLSSAAEALSEHGGKGGGDPAVFGKFRLCSWLHNSLHSIHNNETFSRVDYKSVGRSRTTRPSFVPPGSPLKRNNNCGRWTSPLTDSLPWCLDTNPACAFVGGLLERRNTLEEGTRFEYRVYVPEQTSVRRLVNHVKKSFPVSSKSVYIST